MLELDDMVIVLMGAPSNLPTLEDRLEGITRLEKLIFLLQRETNYSALLTEDPEFRPFNFGPFSARVYKAVNYLSAYGLIEDSAEIAQSDEDMWEQLHVIEDGHRDPYATRIFTLTEDGKRYYEALVSELKEHGHDISEMIQFKQKFGSLPLRQLIRYVYNTYPDTTTQSLIRDEVMRNG